MKRKAAPFRVDERPPVWTWCCVRCGLAIRAAARWAPVCDSDHAPRRMRVVWEDHEGEIDRSAP